MFPATRQKPFNKIVLLLTSRVSRNIFFWILFTFFHYYPRNDFTAYISLLVLVSVFYGIPIYINNLYLIPRYLVKKKLIIYFSLLTLLVFTTILETNYIQGWMMRYMAPAGYMSFIGAMGLPYHIFQIMILFVVMATGKFAGDAIGYEQYREMLNKNLLESELENLKAQVNPHFLFNALNTIYGLARRSDPKTSDAVLLLSGILMHNLYEGSEDVIFLSREVEVLKQYIAFSKLRVHEEDRIRFITSNEIQEQRIAPMILLPFVENAIKHGSGHISNKYLVDIDLKISGNEIIFRCENAIIKNNNTNKNGIGLQNVKRRLELCYPGRHDLKIHPGPERFIVELKLNLS
jgi:Histidine kinase